MVKLMLTITFRSDMSKLQAHTHWRTVHRDLVLATPGVTAYTQHVKLSDVGPEVPWDGIVELTFADQHTYENAMESAEWEAVNADSPNFVDVDQIRTGIVDSEVHR